MSAKEEGRSFLASDFLPVAVYRNRGGWEFYYSSPSGSIHEAYFAVVWKEKEKRRKRKIKDVAKRFGKSEKTKEGIEITSWWTMYVAFALICLSGLLFCDASIISSSNIESCINYGIDSTLNCSQKVVVSMTLAGGQVSKMQLV